MTAPQYLVGYRDDRPSGDKDTVAREQDPQREWLLLEVRPVPGDPVDLPGVVKRIQELAKELGDWGDTRVLEASAGGDSSVPLLLVRVAAWLDLAGKSYARIQDAGDADVPAELIQVLDAIPAVTR